VAQTRLRGKVDHGLRFVLFKEIAQQPRRFDLAIADGKICVFRQQSLTRFLQAHIIVIVHAVDADHLPARLQQGQSREVADETA
jgi:hypothetical protein